MRLVGLLGLICLVGLAVAPPAVAQTANGLTRETAIEISSAEPTSGSLVGNTGGASRFYWFDYPEGRKDATLVFNFTPSDAPMTKAVGVHIWDGRNVVAKMTGSSDTKGSNRVIFFAEKATRLTVEVSNYLPREVFFQLVLRGVPAREGFQSQAPAAAPSAAAPAPAPRSGDGRTPDTAIVLSGSASGSLVGNSGGAYAYYRLENQPGKTATAKIDFSPSDDPTTRSVALYAWQGPNRLGSINGGESTVKGSAQFFFSSTDTRPVILQVHNYRHGVALNYTVSVTWS